MSHKKEEKKWGLFVIRMGLSLGWVHRFDINVAYMFLFYLLLFSKVGSLEFGHPFP